MRRAAGQKELRWLIAFGPICGRVTKKTWILRFGCEVSLPVKSEIIELFCFQFRESFPVTTGCTTSVVLQSCASQFTPRCRFGSQVLGKGIEPCWAQRALDAPDVSLLNFCWWMWKLLIFVHMKLTVTPIDPLTTLDKSPRCCCRGIGQKWRRLKFLEVHQVPGAVLYQRFSGTATFKWI